MELVLPEISQIKSSAYYVYGLVGPDGQVEYVGMTGSFIPRMAAHCKGTHSQHDRARSEWILDCHAQGTPARATILATLNTKFAAERFERKEIARLKPRLNQKGAKPRKSHAARKGSARRDAEIDWCMWDNKYLQYEDGSYINPNLVSPQRRK